MTVKKPPTTKQYNNELQRMLAIEAWFHALPPDSILVGPNQLALTLLQALISRAQAATTDSDRIACYAEMQAAPHPAP